jgi:hypothetical protein
MVARRRRRSRGQFAWYPYLEAGWAATAAITLMIVRLDRLPLAALVVLVAPGLVFVLVRVVAAIADAKGGAR